MPLSRSSRVNHATMAPRDRLSRRHCANSRVLPKPAGACTAMAILSSNCGLAKLKRGRTRADFCPLGGVTLSTSSGSIRSTLNLPHIHAEKYAGDVQGCTVLLEPSACGMDLLSDKGTAAGTVSKDSAQPAR